MPSIALSRECSEAPDLRADADEVARSFSESSGDHKLWVTLAHRRTNDKVIPTENRRLRLSATPDLHGSFF